MSAFSMTIYTLDQIHSNEIGEQFLAILDKNHFTPKKIGTYQPLKQEFSSSKFLSLWTEESEGCYEEGSGMVGKAGGLMATRKTPYFHFQMNWWLHPDKSNLNCISFQFTAKTMHENTEEVLNVFRETTVLLNSIYGYITHNVPLDRQHVTGTLRTRLPGIFWCNYFGELYVDFFGKEIITSYPWHRIEPLASGILTFLTPEPSLEIVKSDELESHVKKHLGIVAFGDLAEYRANPDILQERKAPDL